jgi:hypothetical protein
MFRVRRELDALNGHVTSILERLDAGKVVGADEIRFDPPEKTGRFVVFCATKKGGKADTPSMEQGDAERICRQMAREHPDRTFVICEKVKRFSVAVEETEIL